MLRREQETSERKMSAVGAGIRAGRMAGRRRPVRGKAGRLNGAKSVGLNTGICRKQSEEVHPWQLASESGIEQKPPSSPCAWWSECTRAWPHGAVSPETTMNKIKSRMNFIFRQPIEG